MKRDRDRDGVIVTVIGILLWVLIIWAFGWAIPNAIATSNLPDWMKFYLLK